jgi:hypothetical protein
VENVSVKLFYANRSTNEKYPPLPNDFWTSFSPTPEWNWRPIVPARSLPEGQKTLTNTEPTILAWQWYVPKDIMSEQLGILVVVESSEDSIPQNNKKIIDIEKLVEVERHVELKTVRMYG